MFLFEKQQLFNKFIKHFAWKLQFTLSYQLERQVLFSSLFSLENLHVLLNNKKTFLIVNNEQFKIYYEIWVEPVKAICCIFNLQALHFKFQEVVFSRRPPVYKQVLNKKKKNGQKTESSFFLTKKYLVFSNYFRRCCQATREKKFPTDFFNVFYQYKISYKKFHLIL